MHYDILALLVMNIRKKAIRKDEYEDEEKIKNKTRFYAYFIIMVFLFLERRM